MGLAFSSSDKSPPPQVVLVPPLLDTRERGRSRFAKSSYDRAFGQPQLRILFGDYLTSLVSGGLRFSPPEDERINVSAKLGIAPERGDPSERAQCGTLTLRYQPDASVPWTFCDVKAKTQGSQSSAALRGCYFHQNSGLAAFGILPVLAPSAGPPSNNLRLGCKYSSPSYSLGGIMNPSSSVLHQAWLVGRAGGLILGCQTSPDMALNNVSASNYGDFAAACQASTSWAVAYQPEGQSAYGRGIFTALVELHQQRQLNIAFLHHMAVQRNVHNPLEKSDVVGISNYLDIGLQMIVDIENNTNKASGSGMRLAASWQANKNVMVKARAGMDGVAAALVLKSWWQPSFTLGLAYSKDFTPGSRSRFGLTANFETYKNLRYERSAEGLKMSGARITQRHVASEDDVAYHEGRGLLVPLEDVDNPEVLGLGAPAGADCL